VSGDYRTLDAHSLRGLAHPLRVRLLRLLRIDGPATATGLAQRLGETSGTTSWHLRQLAEHGFVEDDAERGNRRERWWRATAHGTVLELDEFWPDPDLREVAVGYLGALLHDHYRHAGAFLTEDWGQDWAHAANVASHLAARLTPAEARGLGGELLAVIERYRALRDPAVPVPGTETVLVQWQVFPHRPEGRA
jgi:DNA-binding transcriptional ArsR family regulator